MCVVLKVSLCVCCYDEGCDQGSSGGDYLVTNWCLLLVQGLHKASHKELHNKSITRRGGLNWCLEQMFPLVPEAIS